LIHAHCCLEYFSFFFFLFQICEEGWLAIIHHGFSFGWSLLGCSHFGNHPQQEELAKFGYRTSF
jgi:hypothetical protein